MFLQLNLDSIETIHRITTQQIYELQADLHMKHRHTIPSQSNSFSKSYPIKAILSQSNSLSNQKRNYLSKKFLVKAISTHINSCSKQFLFKAIHLHSNFCSKQ